MKKIESCVVATGVTLIVILASILAMLVLLVYVIFMLPSLLLTKIVDKDSNKFYKEM